MKNHKHQRGMTLVETIIALGISSVIIVALGTSIYTIMNITGRGNAEISALRDIQSASYWINNDAQMAREAALDGGRRLADGITLEWDDSTGNPHTSVFSLSETELLRNHDDTSIVIARYISSVEFSVTRDVLIYTIVSTPPGRWNISRSATGQVSLRAYSEE